MELINRVYDLSSELVEDLSSTNSDFHKEIIRKYIEKRLTSNDTIPTDFKQDLDWINIGKPLSFTKELKGKIVVLDFFTYCCINCIHVLPQLKRLEQSFTVEDGLVIIGVHSPKFSNEHSTSNVEAAVMRYEITHPVVNDHGENMWNNLGICCWPTLVIIGPNGELLLYLMGESHGELLHLFVGETISILKAKNALSPHSITEIEVHNQNKESQLYFPGKVCATKIATGYLIAVADTGHHRVLIIDGSGVVQHIIGGTESGFKDGSFEVSRFHAPQGLVFTNSSTLYVADTENHAIRQINLDSAFVETVVGDGTKGEDKLGGKVGMQQQLSSPWDLVALSPSVLLIAMAGSHQIWAYFIQDTVFWKNKQYKAGSCAAIAGSGREENRNNAYPQNAGFAQPSGLTVAACRQTIYVADSESSTVRAISITDGRVSALVGGLSDPQDLFAFGDEDGFGLEARLQHPLGIAWSDHKEVLFVCDSYNHKIKIVDPSSRMCSTFTDKFNEPGGLCAIDNLLYIADTNNHCIKTMNIEDHSMHTINLQLNKNEQKESKIQKDSKLVLKPIKEVQVFINSEGGVLELSISVQVSADIKPLSESPAVWSLTLPEGCDENKAEEQEGVSKKWIITIPGSKKPEGGGYHLRPQCRLFYCYNSLCSVQVLHFLVTVLYNDNAPTHVLCPVDCLFSL